LAVLNSDSAYWPSMIIATALLAKAGAPSKLPAWAKLVVGAAWSLRTRSTQVVRAATPAGLSKAVLVPVEFRNWPPSAHSRPSQS
jgi:hypothetical protein